MTTPNSKRGGFLIPAHQRVQPTVSSTKKEEPASYHAPDGIASSNTKEGDPPWSRGKSSQTPSPKMSTDLSSRKSSCHSKWSPPSKGWHDMHEKDSRCSSCKHRDKPCSERSSKDKESSKCPQKYAISLQGLSSKERAGKEPYIEKPSHTFNASSQNYHRSPSRYLNETDDQGSFMGPTSTSTPNKIDGGLHLCSVSCDSRHSMTHFEVVLSRSFSIPSYARVCHGSFTPVTSMARLQQVTSSGWHKPELFSALMLQAVSTLSTDQAAEVY